VTADRTMRSADPARHGLPVGGDDEGSRQDFASRTVLALADHARLVEWAERIRQSGNPSAPLVARPEPDHERPHYPSAIRAYREMSELLAVL
jgi:hypothetical protein